MFSCIPLRWILNVSNTTDISATEEQVRRSASRVRAIRRWLSPTDLEPDFYKDDHYQSLSRKIPGTCDWFCQGQFLREWRDSPKRVLWISGKPGCGKTVLSSAIVENLNAEISESSTIKIAHFQFKNNDQGKNSDLALLKSLILQLVNSDDLLSLLGEVYDSSVNENATSQSLCFPLSVILQAIVSKLSTVFFVIDAIDECRDMESCLDQLLHLAGRNASDREEGGVTQRIKIVLLSRMEHEIVRPLDTLDYSSYSIHSEDTQHDIELYLSNVMETSYRLKRLPKETKDRVRTSLAQRAEGMFLWTRLMVDELQKKQLSQAAVEQCITRLPRGLPAIYGRIIDALDQDDTDTIRIFRGMTAAREPLRQSEVIALLQIDPDKDYFDKARKIEGPISDWLYYTCGPMVEIEEGRLKFVHATAVEYLLNQANPHFRMDHLDAHEDMALTCLAYLLNSQVPDFTKPVASRGDRIAASTLLGRSDLHFLRYASLNWIDHLVNSRSPISSPLMRKVLKFIDNTHCLTWLEVIFRICHHPAAYINEAAARLSAFANNAEGQGKRFGAGVQRWVLALVGLVRDWSSVLESDPANVHHISSDWFDSSSPFLNILKGKTAETLKPLSCESITQWNRAHKMGREWRKFIDFFEPSTDRYFVLLRNEDRYSVSLSCRSSETGLLLGEIALENKRNVGLQLSDHFVEGIRYAHLEMVSFSNDQRYLACLLRGQWQDYENYVFDTYLIDLESPQAYSKIMSTVQWSNTFLIESVKIPRSSYHRQLKAVMEIDLLNPGLSFSPDGKVLFTPGGTWNLATGLRGDALIEHSGYFAARFSENASFAACINKEWQLEICDLTSTVAPSIKVATAGPFNRNFPKIIAVSPEGRFTALWLFKPREDWDSRKILPRWFSMAELVIFDRFAEKTTVLCCAREVFRTSPLSGHFSDDGTAFLVVLKGESLPPNEELESTYHQGIQGKPALDMSVMEIKVFRTTLTSKATVSWVMVSTIRLFPGIRDIAHPPPLRLDLESARIKALLPNGPLSIELASGQESPLTLACWNDRLSIASTGAEVCGISVSQDQSKILTLSNSKMFVSGRSASDGQTAYVDGQIISIPALFEYLEDRKHYFASRDGLYDGLSELFTRHRNGQTTAEGELAKIAELLEPIPNMFQKVADEIGRGSFTVRKDDWDDAKGKSENHEGQPTKPKASTHNVNDAYSLCSTLKDR